MKDLSIEELIQLRKECRSKKDFKKSDEIRDYLDSKGCFLFDTPDDVIAYHTKKHKTRQEVLDYAAEQRRSAMWIRSFTISNLDPEGRKYYQELCKEEDQEAKNNPLYYIFN